MEDGDDGVITVVDEDDDEEEEEDESELSSSFCMSDWRLSPDSASVWQDKWVQ